MPHRTSFSKLFLVDVAFYNERRREDFESWSELRSSVSRRSHRKEKRDVVEKSLLLASRRRRRRPRASSKPHKARDFPVEIALKRRETERERERAKERKHDARKKHRTHVDVNSFASLRTGRSNTLKSKFKDVIDDDDAGRVCFFLPFKKGRKCDDSDGVKRDKKGL